MNMQFNAYRRAEPYKIYLGDISGNILYVLNAIQADSVRLTCRLNNSCELSFKVDKYLDFYGKKILSNGYELLDEFMRIYVENVGWFLMSAPDVTHDGNSETLSIKAQSIDTELIQHDLRGFKVNYATPDSIEMLVPGNTEVIEGTEIPKKQVTFCNLENPKLSLLHIVLKFAEVKGWSIGHIDEIPKVYTSFVDGKPVEKSVQLKDETGRFDIDNQNVYSFLTQDIERYFECIILFDIENMTINAVRPEHIGKTTNVTIGLRNIQNSNSISVDEGNIYTRYRVSGDDNLNIRFVNFGSDVIEDISYFLNTKYLPQETIAKYNAWKSDTESRRYEYMEAVRKYNSRLKVLSELKDRVPLDDCSAQWNKFNDEELQKAKDNYTAQLKGYEAFYQDENGNFDEAKLNASPDANDYYQIRDVILANINIEIENRGLDTSEGAKDYIKTYETDWKLYGIDELQIHIDFYKTQLKHLNDSHFDLPYVEYAQNSEKDAVTYPPHTREVHEAQHVLYLENTIQLDESISGSCANAYEQRTSEYKTAEALSEDCKADMSAIALSVDKESWRQNGIEPFTAKELTALSRLYKDTDYTNKNMFLSSFDDLITQIDEELKLYQAAAADLEAKSQPQYVYDTTLDNFLTLYDYRQFAQNLGLGDFIYLAVTDDSLVKLRLISYTFNPASMDNDLQIEFSNMIQTKSKRYDISYLLKSGGGSSKNSISGDSHDYGKNEGLSITQNLLNKLLASTQYVNNVENIINQHFQSLIGQLVIAKGLEAEMIKVTRLDAEDGFFQYLQTALVAADKIVAGSGIFDNLHAKVGAIDGLLAGNISAELGHLIRLTAENVSVDEAFIRELIAAQITVSMLKAGDITLNGQMRILSENGYLTMNGETLQVKGIKENGETYVAIQLGYSAAGNPALIICDENGAVMLDAHGLHESIIPDGLIQSDMIGKGQIQKDHLAFQTVETDKNGNVDASKVLINGQGLQVQFTSIEETVTKVTETTGSLSAAIDTISDSISPYTGDFTSEKGTVFDKSTASASTTLTAHVYRGTTEMAPEAYTVSWFKRKDNGVWQQFSTAPAVKIDLSEFQTSNDIYFEFEVLENTRTERKGRDS